jgi:hypothetical protein
VYDVWGQEAMNSDFNPASNLYDELRRVLGIASDQEIPVAAVRERYTKTNVPELPVAYIALAMQTHVNRYEAGTLSPHQADALFAEGAAISNYIDRVLSQEHPMDKRFLLRYMENVCMQLGNTRQTSVGFGHVIVYSREPFVDSGYESFDNTLYVPPLTGHWAIVKRKER